MKIDPLEFRELIEREVVRRFLGEGRGDDVGVAFDANGQLVLVAVLAEDCEEAWPLPWLSEIEPCLRAVEYERIDYETGEGLCPALAEPWRSQLRELIRDEARRWARNAQTLANVRGLP